MNVPATLRRFDTSLSRQQQLFLFSSLMLLTCYFLPWRIADAELSPSGIVAITSSPFQLTVLLSLYFILCIVPLTTRREQLRPWIGILASLCVLGTLVFLSITSGTTGYGAVLARFFALLLLCLSARPAVITAGDFAMRRLNSQKAEVFTHWGTVSSAIQFSAQEFYAKLEGEIRERKWPGVELLRVAYTEAGLLSHNREYLRIIRQRQVVDICASTFGRDYFFTMREAEIQPGLALTTLLILAILLGMVLSSLVSALGLVTGATVFFLVLFLSTFLLFNVLRMGLTGLDGLLMRTPVVGAVYETWFRRSTTYFQHDSRMVFLKLVDDLVKEHVDEETSAKGIQLLSCFEHQPILDGLYKSTTRTNPSMKESTSGAH